MSVQQLLFFMFSGSMANAWCFKMCLGLINETKYKTTSRSMFMCHNITQASLELFQNWDLFVHFNNILSKFFLTQEYARGTYSFHNHIATCKAIYYFKCAKLETRGMICFLIYIRTFKLLSWIA